jgi:DNA repair protein RadC
MTYRVKTIRVALTVQEPVSVVSSPAQAENVLRPIFERLDTDREHFVLLALNAQNHIVGYKVVSTGGAAASIVDPKTLFRDALLLGAVSLILAHNHPSGDPAPSREDIRLTRQLADAGKLLEIRLHDHVIVGTGDAYVSFAERGLL